jgi:ABC-type transporter Mla MlaB component
MAGRAPQPIAFAIRGPIARADLPGLYERLCALLERAGSGTGVVLCDLAGVGADAGVVDALARLELAARRRGWSVRLRHASPELLDLVAFMGLEQVLSER